MGIPIAGPILWTASDEDNFGNDGWDWLAIVSTFCQGAGVYGAGSKPSSSQKKITVVPDSGRNYGGITFSGTL